MKETGVCYIQSFPLTHGTVLPKNIAIIVLPQINCNIIIFVI